MSARSGGLAKKVSGSEIFSSMREFNHEQVVFINQPEPGLRAIIGIHQHGAGTSSGGTRMWPYESEDAALQTFFVFLVECHIKRRWLD